jgi:hypothetical protein
MRKFEGTQGSWLDKNYRNPVIVGSDFLALSCGVASEESLANGRLIKCAPDLLEQLQKIVADYESEIHDRYDGTHSLEELLAVTKGAHAAINKALGGE